MGDLSGRTLWGEELPMKKRIVITGMGVVSPIGNGVDRFWKGLTEGKYGIDEVPCLDEKIFSKRLYGFIQNFDFKDFSEFKGIIGRASAFGIEATREALSQAKLLEADKTTLNKVGVIIGSLAGENGLREQAWIKYGWNSDIRRPFNFSTMPLISHNIARWFGLRGPNSTISTACSSSAYAIASACEMIRNDYAPIMVVGGVESLTLVGQGNFIRINALDSEKIRPFDRKRQGTLLGEGAGIMVIESLESAISRGVSILAEVKGIGLSCDGHHESAPDPSGRQIINATQRALSNASLSIEAIDCISVHGTGTVYNDRLETEIIKTVFGEKARDISITANKSMLGHGVGAACAMAIVAAVLMMENGLVVPTINFENWDPECDLDYTVNTPHKRELRNVMVDSYAFGGNNATVIISRLNE